MGFLLRRLHLPPPYVPPLVVPAVFRDSVRTLRVIARKSLQRVRPASARRWLRDHLQFRSAPQRRWVHEVNGKQAIASFSGLEFDGHDHGQLGYKAIYTPSLQAIGGRQWRLPI